MGNRKDNEKLIDLTRPEQEVAILVGQESSRHRRWEVEDSLDELSQLALTAGYREADRVVSRRATSHPATYVGKGKVSEIAAAASGCGATTVIFDDELSPSQGRNLQNALNLGVVDRTELILSIFAARARTREARLQIEMASLSYQLPRLAGAWGHLNRQKGGAKGTRDAGEKQIELDRRTARDRIHRLKKEIEEVRKQRQVQRARRCRREIPVIALIGYTNAGKSTLLNSLTGSGVFVEDKLFATLDPTIRAAELPSGRRILLTDTVGFIRKLPHHLVESFQATLEEAVRADVLIEVLDASHKMVRERKQAVEEVLEQLQARDRTRLIVLNKCDLVKDPFLIPELENTLGAQAAISARTGEGLDDLLGKVEGILERESVIARLLLPVDRADLVSYLHREGRVLRTDYHNSGVYVEAELSERVLEPLREFQLTEKQAEGV